MQNGGHKTGSRNNFLTERDGGAISTAVPIFSTMPDLDISLTTLSDVDRHPELKMSDTKPEVETTFEQKEMAT